MSGSEFQFAYLRDPRLAAHALSPSPAWLWSADATRILWANPTAAAIFDCATPAEIEQISFEPKHPAAAQIARLAGTLPQGGAPRLERLRGFGTGFGAALTCLCSRITLADNSVAVLIVATERAGPDLALHERARRLIADNPAPAATFSADGELIVATPAAIERFGAGRDLVALGAEKLAKEASHNGHAEGSIAGGRIALDRLGAGATVVLLAQFKDTRVAAAPRVETNVTTVPQQAPAPPNPVTRDTAMRRSPLRFVWQMDADTRFTVTSEDFARLIGPTSAALLGKPWQEIASALKLDPQGQVAGALNSRDTWSGIIVHWPLDNTAERLPVELSGLPEFDRERRFSGYRGFGVCRDVERLVALTQRTPATPEQKADDPAGKILPFRQADKEPTLSPVERTAFQELARELSVRLKKTSEKDATAKAGDDFGPEPETPAIAATTPEPPKLEPPKPVRNGNAARDTQEGRPILDRLPIGILVYRLNNLIYANRAFLDWTGYPTLEELAEAGGLDSLFIESKTDTAAKDAQNGAKTLTITTNKGAQMPVEGRLFPVTWNGDNALVLMLNTLPVVADERQKTADQSLRRIEAESSELKAILDTATDGVLVLDRSGRVLSANGSAEALFGYEAADLTKLSFGDLFAPESRRAVLDTLDRQANDSGASVLDPGKEVIGRVRQGGLIPLYMTMGRIEDGDKICAVFRDITAWKRTEEELINAKQAAEKASTAKSEFLAKISHEIRTPLNAIIGFSEVMMDERFGPVGNDRYRQYLRDIHTSGGHLISLLNDLLDLSKIEAGKLELTFVSVNLNDAVQQCVAIMQEQANRERVIIRTSLAANLPRIVADARSVRQIMLNLLSNSIKFTGAGGQVIVSTALTSDNEAMLRVRDTGTGMSEKELQTALEPFRQLATAARWGSSGTGLGLPITKALSEANHARFRITSEVDHGTLVEVAFPATRVLAQ